MAERINELSMENRGLAWSIGGQYFLNTLELKAQRKNLNLFQVNGTGEMQQLYQTF